MDSPHLKACLDAPLMPDRSTAGIRAGAQAVGPLQVLTHFGGEFERAAGRLDPRLRAQRRRRRRGHEPVLRATSSAP